MAHDGRYMDLLETVHKKYSEFTELKDAGMPVGEAEKRFIESHSRFFNYLCKHPEKYELGMSILGKLTI